MVVHLTHHAALRGVRQRLICFEVSQVRFHEKACQYKFDVANHFSRKSL